MTKEQYVQAGKLANELNAVRQFASDLRCKVDYIQKYECQKDIAAQAQSLTDNLNGLIAVWENQNVTRIENEFNAL